MGAALTIREDLAKRLETLRENHPPVGVFPGEPGH